MKTKITIETAECIKAFATSAKRAFERFPQLKQMKGSMYRTDTTYDEVLDEYKVSGGISCCFMGAAALDNLLPEGAVLDDNMIQKIYDEGIRWDLAETRYPCIRQGILDEDFGIHHYNGDPFIEHSLDGIIVELNDCQGLSIDEIADRLTAFADAAAVTPPDA